MKSRFNNLSEQTAKKVTNLLNKELVKDANSAACSFLYQPKTPKELARFRK